MKDCKNCKHLIMFDYKNRSYSCESGNCEFDPEEQEPTTKNNLGVDCISRQEVIDLLMQKWGENFSGDDAMQESIDAIRVMPSVTQLSSELEKNSQKLDCISRADAIRVASGYCHPSNVAKELAKLPSVTPQEPTDKNFTKADIDAIVKAINKGWELRVNEILSKIRAEIEQLSTTTCTETRRIYIDADDFKENVLAIFDKYKAESEEE